MHDDPKCSHQSKIFHNLLRGKIISSGKRMTFMYIKSLIDLWRNSKVVNIFLEFIPIKIERLKLEKDQQKKYFLNIGKENDDDDDGFLHILGNQLKLFTILLPFRLVTAELVILWQIDRYVSFKKGTKKTSRFALNSFISRVFFIFNLDTERLVTSWSIYKNIGEKNFNEYKWLWWWERRKN